MSASRCHWVKSEDGTCVLIPGCWARVHDPDADCTCGEWSEASERQTIRSMKASVFRERATVQALRAELRKAGLTDPTLMHPAWASPENYTARKRRRAMHKAISEAGQ